MWFLINGKRGPLIFSVASAIAVYFICIYKGTINNLIKLLLGIVVLTVVFVIAANTVTAVNDFVARFQGASDLNSLSSGRVNDLWVPALLIFVQAPLFGIGWRGFIYTFHAYSTMVQDNNAHNIYLQLLCETGVVGLVVFVYIFVLTLIHSIKLAKQVELRKDIDKANAVMIVFAVMIQIFFLVEGIVGNTLYGLTFYVYCFAVAFIYSILIGRTRIVKKTGE